MRIRRLLLAASLILAGPAFGQLPRPGVSIPASKVSISGYTNTDLQSGLSEGEIASIRPAADCTLVDGGKPNEICRDTDDQTLWICTNATSCEHTDWVAHGGGGGSGDSVSVEGAGVTNLNLIGGTTGIDITLDTGPSPDTATFSLDWSEITNVVTEASLKAVDSPADEECLTYETTGGDFEWQSCGGTATSLDSGQTGTTYDVKFGTTTTQWYQDVDGDDVVDQGEQIQKAGRLQVPLLTMTGAGLTTAITACGTTPCDINIPPGNVTNVCVKIASKNNIHFLGAGKGITTLVPYTDPDDCLALADPAPVLGNMIQIDGSTDIWFAHMTFDGKKQDSPLATCSAVSLGGSGGCGIAIWVLSPGNTISRNIRIFDNEFKNLINAGVQLSNHDDVLVENSSFTDLGCAQTADGVGDNPCGSTLGAGNGGWTGAADVAAVVGQKTKGLGVVADVGALGSHVIIRNNSVSNVTYNGIEVFGGSAANCGTYTASGCPSHIEIAHNDVTLAPGGIVLNGSEYVWIHGNVSHGNRQTNGSGDSGNGILVGSGSNANVLIEDNQLYSNDGQGIILKSAGGSGFTTISRNLVANNCLDHNNGANLDAWSSGTQSHNITIEDNVISASTLCTYGLRTLGSTNSILGHVTVIGNTVADSGSSGAAFLDAANQFVQGNKITGTFTFGGNSSGLTLGNEGTAATYVNSSTTSLDLGVMNLRGGASSGQLQISEPSASGTNKATFVVPALAADTNYTLPTTDGAASEFLQTNGSGVLTWAAPAGAGTITGVGPAFTTGLAFTDGTASTSNVMLVWEGSTVDTNEFSLLAPCTTCNASDINITFPATTGTLVGTGDTGGVTSAMITDDEIDVADIYNGQTIGANPGYAANEVWFGTTGLIFEGTTANTIEGLLTAATITTADKTWTLPDASGFLVTSAAALAISGTPTGAKFLRDDGVWTAIPGGGDALVANPLSQFAATTSAQLYGVLSNETGSATGTPLAVFNQSPTIDNPTLTTPALGAATATSIVASGAITAASFTATPSATPTLALRDSDNTDSEDNVRLFGNCVVTTTGAEDCTVTVDQYVDGVVKNAFSSIGDGAGTIGSDQNTSWSIVTAGTGDAALVVPTGSISGLEILDATITYSDVSHTETLAGNPANGASAAWWGTTGIIFEGSTSDASELLLTAADPAADVTLTLPASTGTLPVIIAQGTVALDTDAIASTACDTSDTAISATGTLSTDVLSWSFNADITAITGYAPATTGALIIYAYPSADAVNFKVCNPTTSSITPGSAVTLNWKVIR